jgi:hypothetical protein
MSKYYFKYIDFKLILDILKTKRTDITNDNLKRKIKNVDNKKNLVILKPLKP